MLIRDGEWALFDWDSQTGRTIWHYFDGRKDHWRIEYPVDNLIRQNQIERTNADKSWRGDWHKIASVPAPLFWGMGEGRDGLKKALDQGDDKWVSRWLNDPDHRAFRTKEGAV